MTRAPELSGLRKVWEEVLRGIKEPHLFQQFDWYRAYIETNREGAANSFFVVLSDEGAPIGIFPFEVRGKVLFGFAGNVLGIPHSQDADFGDFILPKDESSGERFLYVLSRLRREAACRWSRLEVPVVFADSALHCALEQSDYDLCSRQQTGHCNYLRLGSYDEVWAGLSKRFKKALRNARNRLEQLDGSTISSELGSENVASAFRELVELETAGWKGVAGSSIRQDEAGRRFYERLVELFAAKGACRIDLLKLGERTIAALWSLQVGSTVYTMKIAFDEAEGRVSPGVLLLDGLIRESADDPSLSTVNFMSDQPLGGRWQPSSMGAFHTTVFARTAYGTSAWVVATVRLRFKRALRTLRTAVSKNIVRSKKTGSV